MAKFTDANGVDWSVSIDLGTVYDYHQESGEDLFEIAAGGRIPVLSLMELGYVSVKPQAKERGYTSCREWLKGIGKASVTALSAAVGEEVAGFFPETKEMEGDDDAPENPPSPSAGTGDPSSE